MHTTGCHPPLFGYFFPPAAAKNKRRIDEIQQLIDGSRGERKQMTSGRAAAQGRLDKLRAQAQQLAVSWRAGELRWWRGLAEKWQVTD